VRRTRVLVVDDSVVARRILVRALSQDPSIEVVGTASNGRIALAKIEQSNPDVVTLDIEMPEMNGLDTLATLRQTHPMLAAVMFSAFTQPDAVTILDILASHGVDYVTKPQPGAGPDATEKAIRERLLPTIKRCRASALSFEATGLTKGSSLSSATNCSAEIATTVKRIDVVVIGVSTGGPDALGQLLPCFPADFPLSILIAQHMPAFITKQLAERLATASRIQVSEAISGQKLLPGHAWLAPGDTHMSVTGTQLAAQLHLDQGPRVNSCRPSADVLFQSAVKIFGGHVLGVVMTGMGQDGLRGCQEVHQAGGQILVQDQASSIVWGMPGAIVAARLFDRVLPLRELGDAILGCVNARRDLTN